jgi:hypothetical protein
MAKVLTEDEPRRIGSNIAKLLGCSERIIDEEAPTEADARGNALNAGAAHSLFGA